MRPGRRVLLTDDKRIARNRVQTRLKNIIRRIAKRRRSQTEGGDERNDREEKTGEAEEMSSLRESVLS